MSRALSFVEIEERWRSKPDPSPDDKELQQDRRDVETLIEMLLRFFPGENYQPKDEDLSTCDRCGKPIFFAYTHGARRILVYDGRAAPQAGTKRAEMGTHFISPGTGRDGLPDGSWVATYVVRDERKRYPRMLFRNHRCATPNSSRVINPLERETST